MIVTFLGTGETCDPHRRNTSILIEAGQRQILLDCGFSSAQAYIAKGDPSRLTGVWFSHFHGDHFLGFPQLAAYLYMKRRTEPLTIFSGSDSSSKTVLSAIELAYPGLTAKLGFSLEFQVVPTGETVADSDFRWQSAPTIHTVDSFSLRLCHENSSLYYSGDGRPGERCVELMRDCDLVVHEAFSMSPKKPSHSSIEECLNLAGKLPIKQLALVHISLETRIQLSRNGRNLQIPSGSTLFIPADGEVIRL